MRRSAATVVTLVTLGLVLAGPGTPANSASQEGCVAAALKQPRIGNVGVRHAGHAGGKTQHLYFKARYDAMPDACLKRFFRASHAKGQVFYKGRWIRINDWHGLYGGTLEVDAHDTGSHLNTQVAYTATYESPPPLADKPTRFRPCRVRILLKQSVTHPVRHSDSGYHPTHNIAETVYVIPVPVSRISPHRGHACKLLVPDVGPNAIY
jgi:hypothetical protein